MNLSKKTVIREFAKLIFAKLGVLGTFLDQSTLDNLEKPYLLLLLPYEPKLKEIGLLKNDQIDLDILERELLKVFEYTPIIRIPIMGTEITFNKDDALKFLDNLDQAAQSESIICLPCN